jgi:hypothetical protein
VEKHDDRDGRLFAIDITAKLINETDRLRDWEDANSRPWKDRLDEDDPAEQMSQEEWSTTTLAWKPPPFEQRIAAQNGAFLFGGVPISRPRFQFKKDTPPGSGYWPISTARECTSIHLKMNKANPKAGGVPGSGSPAYTDRIAGTAKADIRRHLEAMFGYSHKTIYPDFPGFATFGIPGLPAQPPAA